MQYFFILGNNPTLSLAEISAVFGLDKIQGYLAAPDVFILETGQEISPAELIKKLGGTIKIGLIMAGSEPNKEALLKQAISLIDKQEKPGKFKFGLSYYGCKKMKLHRQKSVASYVGAWSETPHRKPYGHYTFIPRQESRAFWCGVNLKPIGMAIKKYLQGQKISCRFVTSKEKTLSSVVVEQNKLTSRGIEIVLIEEDGKILIGKTLAVQPFKELSFRDYGRPRRDDYSGMLPPKLAQIMINLATPAVGTQDVGTQDFVFPQKNFVILDPFCGSGTILTEAVLMGYKNLIGSDISQKAVEDTKKNMTWVKNKFGIDIRQSSIDIRNLSATELSRVIKPQSIDAIITEPYLGPPRGKIDIKKIAQELEQLYTKSLSEFNKILKPGGRIVMIWPVFRISHIAQHITPNINGFKIINPIPESLRQNKAIILTDRNTIIYGREQQKVWREIVILEKESESEIHKSRPAQ